MPESATLKQSFSETRVSTILLYNFISIKLLVVYNLKENSVVQRCSVVFFFFSFFEGVKNSVHQVNMGSNVRRDVHVRMEECVTM